MKRRLVQLLATLLANASPSFLWQGSIYRGWLKGFCFPGLNCYSCPAATFACPLGSLQQVLASLRAIPEPALRAAAYVLGLLFLFGLALGRVVCGWFCPFGFLQELLYKIPGPKFRLPRRVRYLKFLVLAFLVVLLPVLLVDSLGMGHVWFCRLLCPAGTLEAGVFNLLLKPELRGLISLLFYLKLFFLLLILLLCWLFFRFFCVVLCPLGAFYGLFNRLSLFRFEWQATDCLDCRVCEKICPLGLRLPEELNSAECIRCLNCLKVCPISGIRLICSFPSTTRFDTPINSVKPKDN